MWKVFLRNFHSFIGLAGKWNVNGMLLALRLDSKPYDKRINASVVEHYIVSRAYQGEYQGDFQHPTSNESVEI